MVLTKAAKISGTVGALALLVIMFLASDAMAQRQYCQCYDSASNVRVRRAPIRRAANRVRVRRAYRTARVRTVYRTVYVPTTRVAGFVGYPNRDDYVENYTRTDRVVVTEPDYTAGYYGSGYYNTEAIARGWGRRDGFKDGYKAALKNHAYNAEDNGDFRDADNGYKHRFGSKFVYKTAYREGYVRGYDSGFRSVADGRYAVRY